MEKFGELAAANTDSKMEQVIKPLEAHGTKYNLPEIYAHQDKHKEYVRSLNEMKDTLPHNLKYDAYWSMMALGIDNSQVIDDESEIVREKGAVHKHLDELRNDISSESDVRQERYKEYWNNIEQQSIYPRMIEEKTLFEKRAQQMIINNWRDDAKCSETMDSPYDLNLLHSASKVYPYVFNHKLFKQGIGENRHKQHSNSYFQKIKDQEGKEMVGYVVALKLREGANKYTESTIQKRLSTLIDPRNRQSITDDGLPYMRGLLKELSPYHVFSRSIGKHLHEYEVKTFGDESELARALWGAVTFMKTSKLKTGEKALVQEKLINLLLNRKFEEARLEIEELWSETPELFHNFTAQNLDIEPAMLAELKREEGELNNLNNEKTVSAAERLVPLIDNTLYSSDGRCAVRVEAVKRKGFSYYLKELTPEGDDAGNKRIPIKVTDLDMLIDILGLHVKEKDLDHSV